LIVLDIIGNVSPRDFGIQIDLDNIRAFYDSVVSRAGAFQLRWNEKKASKVEEKSIFGLLPLCTEKRNVQFI
jgi:hypothetical protein